MFAYAKVDFADVKIGLAVICLLWTSKFFFAEKHLFINFSNGLFYAAGVTDSER